ncbi:radical SAM protein [Streptomyces sp. NBC_01387]|uniref:B12-binding domain-containing radical SAM protein n=1 Tax=unclassified Streptomyces TaxID=2593676 RepID=UPI002025ABC1|nr:MULTISPECIES: B12-binding domain-containing radical SAM protein [unclassified Streptomyces]MCX4547647.1 radical SAM protein [Streptomyces sp. NBC_01500]WSC19336.1 radical SAM protein [Streptomyces sp. NBC_01766]
MTQPKLLVVVPPQAVSMLNGPPLAPLLLEYALAPHGVDVEFFDANLCFFDWLQSDVVRAAVTSRLKALTAEELSHDALESGDLTRIGRYLSFLESDYCRGGKISGARAGVDWNAVHELLVNPRSEVPDPEFRDLWLSRAMDELCQEILRREPDHIAFSTLFHTQTEAAAELCGRLRGAGFDGRIVLGGAAIKLTDDLALEQLMTVCAADLAYKYSVYGEFPSLAAFVRGECRADEVANATYLDAAGALRHAKAKGGTFRTMVRALSYDLVERSEYLEERIYPVLVSEGCYWGKCDFCDYPFLASQDPFKVSAFFRQATDVVHDIGELVEKRGVSRIDLISDAVPMGYFRLLADAGAGRPRELGARLECSIRAEPKAKAHHFEAMAECGVDLVTIGVESLADEVLEGMQKGNTYTDILRSMRLAREQGIKVKANLIFDHPRMQLRHVEETLEKLDEILQYVESLGIHSFGLTPHAPLAFTPESANLVVLNGQRTTNDHGEHHLRFVRTDMTPELETRLSDLRTAVETAAYQLEIARAGGRKAPDRRKVIRLPYRWDGDRAVRDTVADLSLSIPGESAPFSYFVKGGADG